MLVTPPAVFPIEYVSSEGNSMKCGTKTRTQNKGYVLGDLTNCIRNTTQYAANFVCHFSRCSVDYRIIETEVCSELWSIHIIPSSLCIYFDRRNDDDYADEPWKKKQPTNIIYTANKALNRGAVREYGVHR